ncbi:acyltransferase family protein [Dyella flava]|uniref:Acyltransferase n=1 Tax=Dyella flava TaxID=1920170 RepID=A0ABS2K384_9GAMM|nr:acyltransferase [Dyella flava]MBM7124778.1 acyltransferase [Dyella flava]GLQ50823.1 exopolysaccharide production protein ExoZ [Dyella flava]
MRNDPGSAPARSGPFQSIQVLRGVAALMVVVYHWHDVEQAFGKGPAILDGLVRFGYAGVDIFFVISGFVMAIIAKGQFASPHHAGRFLLDRGLRVLPPYWIYTSMVVALSILATGVLNADSAGKSILASFVLWPQAGFPLLPVGWTLTYEAYFYLVVAIAIATVREQRFTVFLCGWAALISLAPLLRPDTPWQEVIASPMGWEFIAGALIGIHWQRFPARLASPMFWLGTLGFLLAAMLLNTLGIYTHPPWLRTVVFGSCSALIVLGLVVGEAACPRPAYRVLRRVGDASYSIYLSHLFVIKLVAHLWVRTGMNQTPWTHLVFALLALAASAVVGVVSYRWLERPCLRLGKRWLQGLR